MRSARSLERAVRLYPRAPWYAAVTPAAMQELEARRKAERAAAAEERRAAEQGARQAAAAAYQDADWIRAAEEEQLQALDAEVPEVEERQARSPPSAADTTIHGALGRS